MRNASPDEPQTGIKTGRRNSNNLRYADDTTLVEESKEELKSLLMKVKEKSEKAGLKHSTNEDHVIRSHQFMQMIGKNCKQWQVLLSWAPKSLWMVTVAMKLKDSCFLEEKL